MDLFDTKDSEASPNPEPTDEELRIHLVRSMAQIRSELQKWSAAFSRARGGAAADIFRGQGRALALLAKNGDMRQRDMCAALGVRPQSLGEVLTKLERSGYIVRTADATDRRALIVSITDKGRAVADAHEPNMLFSSFNREELKEFIGYLERALKEVSEMRTEMGNIPNAGEIVEEE